MSKLGVLHFWILVHCSFCAGLATVFIWTAVTFWKDWMSTDNQRGQIESDSLLSMVPDSVARASDETAGHDLQNPVYTEFSFAPSTLEQSYPDVFRHEPGLHGMEGSQRDFSFHDLEGCSLPQHFQGEIAAETSDEPVSRSDSNRALFEARMSSMSDVELRVPWETGIMKQLLDRDGEIIFQIIVPAVPPDHLMPFATSGAESSEPLGMSGSPQLGAWYMRKCPCRCILLQSELCLTETCFWMKLHCGKRRLTSGRRFSTFLDSLACWIVRCFPNR